MLSLPYCSFILRNMTPIDQFIEKFQKIYSEEFGEMISKEDAHGKFLRLTNFLRVVLHPPSEPEQDIKSSVSDRHGIDQISSGDKIENQN